MIEIKKSIHHHFLCKTMNVYSSFFFFFFFFFFFYFKIKIFILYKNIVLNDIYHLDMDSLHHIFLIYNRYYKYIIFDFESYILDYNHHFDNQHHNIHQFHHNNLNFIDNNQMKKKLLN